ncbi:hypothetical protein HDU91_007410, partial [Kappamyces sp. JEL0680]
RNDWTGGECPGHLVERQFGVVHVCDGAGDEGAAAVGHVSDCAAVLCICHRNRLL